MSAIAWTVIDPETIEQMIAVGLCRRFTHARRVKPSVGDGGLDVLVPLAGESQMVVENYQVKKFADGLNTSRKRQIKDSLETAIATHNDPKSGYEIKRWHLTLPMWLTREQEQWLVTVAKDLDAPFPVEIFGLTQIEELLSAMPDIRDFYLGDGRAEVEAALARLGRITDIQKLAADPRAPAPPDVTDSLSQLHRTINELDPHFVYDYEVTEGPPTIATAPSGRVASVVAWEGPGSPHVTWHIATKYDAALEDRPIPGKFTVDWSKLTAEQSEALKRFHEFGTPFELKGPRLVDLKFDLPGGLGTGAAETIDAIALSPIAEVFADEPAGRAMWAIEGPGGTKLAEQLFEFRLISQGHGGGQQRRATSEDGSISVDLFTKILSGDDSGTLEARVKIEKFKWVGKPVQRVLPALRFGAAWVEGNQLRASDEFGFNVATQVVPLTGPQKFPEPLVRAVEHLVTISNATKTPIALPSDARALAEREPTLSVVAGAVSGAETQLGIENLGDLAIWHEDTSSALDDLNDHVAAGHLDVPWRFRSPLIGENHHVDLRMVFTGDFSLEPTEPSDEDPAGHRAVRVVVTPTTQLTLRWTGNTVTPTAHELDGD